MRVASLVLNSVSRDARVIRQAQALSQAGHQVTVYGVRRPDDEATPIDLESKFSVSINVADISSEKAKRTSSRHSISLRHKQTVLQKFRLLREHFFEASVRREVARYHAIIDQCSESKPDIVHCHDIDTLPLGLHIKRRTGACLIYDAHELYEGLAGIDPIGSDYARWRHATFLPHIDAIVVVNQSILNWYRKQYQLNAVSAVVVNAAPNEEKPKYDGRLHNSLGLSKDTRILLYQGLFAKQRGLGDLVRSSRRLPSGWTLVMMGWGPLEESLRRDIECPVGSCVSAVKFAEPVPQSELALWTVGASIGLIPYEPTCLNHLYCTPNKLWEYPAAGVPVLASDLPEMRQRIDQYKFGWTLDSFAEPNTVASFLSDLSDQALEIAAGNCGAFLENENWDVAAKALLSVYQELGRKRLG